MMFTVEQLRQDLCYNPTTGIFTDRTTGEVLGCPRGGREGKRYVGVCYRGRSYYAHRLAWLYMTGEWPDDELDHIDTIRDHNWWSNLRPATTLQNSWNRSVSSRSLTQLKGVCVHKSTGLYGARIQVRGVQRSLGYYHCPVAAHLAYIVAANVEFGTYAR